jgi:hypothetical protein
VLDPGKMPESWLPPPKLKESLSSAPWSKAEDKDAEQAIERGVDEMIAFFRRKPSVVVSLWGDSIEALIQVTFSSANKPALDAKVRKAASDNLTMLIDTFFKRKPDAAQVTCDDFERLLPLAIHAHKLYPQGDARTERVTKRANAAYRTCSSLVEATAVDHRKILAEKQVTPDRLFEVYIWALWLMDAELFPAIELPDEARAYGPALWQYLRTQSLTPASKFEDGPWDDKFIAIADLAPHLAHIPTGTHRFPLYVEDFPELYRFHRENFYAVMQVKELDLFASLVDTLRQYGCTPENDIQVRDGTRYLLQLFHAGNDSWMAFRQDGETDATIDDYGLIHYPWTAVLGIRPRQLELPAPDNYGGKVRRWLPAPQAKN